VRTTQQTSKIIANVTSFRVTASYSRVVYVEVELYQFHQFATTILLQKIYQVSVDIGLQSRDHICLKCILG